jgi:pyruvate dehydrogenase E1 component
MLHPLETPRVPYIAQVMNDAPAVASTDYMKLFAEQVRTYVPADDYRVLGTDGFGRSDSRENLRHHFEVDASYVVVQRWANWLNVVKSIRKWWLTQLPNSTSMQKKLTRVWRKR